MLDSIKDTIYKLYSHDNFTLGLTILLIILIILFVIVYFFGKKNEKLEETKRLQKIELDAFKKEEEPVKIEVKEEVKTEEPVLNEEVTVTEFKPEIKILDEEIELPILDLPKKVQSVDKEEEESPISIQELAIFDDEDDKLLGGLSKMDAIKNEFDSIDIPKVKEEEKPKEKPIFKPSPQIFSSVFVEKKEDEKIVKIDNNNIKTFIIDDEEEELDLPSLKDENPLINETQENKSLLSDVSGEVYELK